MSFVGLAFSQQARSNFLTEAPLAKTILALLNLISSKEEFKRMPSQNNADS